MTRRNNLTKRGFTVLEITIAVSVIAILAGLLIYGISHLSASAKANQTKIMLQNNRGMLQEFDTAAGLSRSVSFWPWIDLETGNIYVAPANPTYFSNGSILWTSSVVYKSTIGGNPATPSGPLCAPGGPWNKDVIKSIGFANRNGSYAVLYTQIAMRMLGGLSATKAMIAKIPSGSIMVPVWITGAPYVPGNVVQSPTDNKYYRCITNLSSAWAGQTESAFLASPTGNGGSSPYTSDPNADSADWTPLGSSETPDPILLDAWGNPILMAPAAGLINVWTNCTSSARAIFPPPQWPGSPAAPTSQLQAWAFPVPTSEAPGQSYYQKPIVAPDGKPFFYSAGPDGDFTTGDDNLYSFDK